MSFPNARKGINQYSQVGTSSGVESASPHRLIQLLMEGALDKLAAAKGFVERGDIAEKGRFIFWAISIIGGLRGSLDMDKGGEISQNLYSLYDYMERRLVEANRNDDIAMIDEVIELLREVKVGWDDVPMALRDGPVQSVHGE